MVSLHFGAKDPLVGYAHARTGFCAWSILVALTCVPPHSAYCAEKWDVPAQANFVRLKTIAIDPVELCSTLRDARGTTVRLSLFEDITFDCLIRSAEVRYADLRASGELIGEPFGHFVVTIDSGQVAGGFWSRRGTFGLLPTGRTDAAGLALVSVVEWRPGASVQCIGVQMPDRQVGPDNSILAAGLTLPSGYKAGDIDSTSSKSALSVSNEQSDSSGPLGPQGCDCTDDGATLDVLCVYTTKARDAAGGVAALKARAQNAFDTTTAAMSNSAVGGLTVQMVGFVEINYDEVSSEWLDHLKRVTEPDDGYMDDVHALRNQYKADTVALFVDDDRFTGGAAWWAHQSEALAFSCMNWRAAGGGSLTVAHELGHNFGCAHDRAHDSFAPFDFGWGYHFNHDGVEYGTIMSYVGTTIPYYSNPTLEYLGVPIGAPVGDPATAAANALVISNTRLALTNYRASDRMHDCNGNGVSDETDIANGTSADGNGNCRPDECELRLYVDVNADPGGDGSSWANAWHDLAAALRLASLSCSNISEIWVADGVYLPDSGSGDRWARFPLRSGLALYGGFQGQSRSGGGETQLDQRDPGTFATVLSGDIGAAGDSADNCYSVVEAVGVDDHAVLDGFTIRAGNSFADAGGLWCDGGAPAIRGCVFAANHAAGSGGAIRILNDAAPTIANCRFEGNAADYYGGAIGITGGAAPRIVDCSFAENAGQYGGAIWAYDFCNPLFERCSFFENAASAGGGAAGLYGNCAATLSDCQFSGNTAGTSGGGALRVTTSQLQLIRSSLSDHSAAWGGAIASDRGDLVLRECELSQNTASSYSSGALDLYASTASISNCLFSDNRAADYGGALGIFNGSTISVINTTIYANKAADYGGGAMLFDGTLNVTNCIFWANSDASSDPEGAQLSKFGGTLSIDYSCVAGWTGDLGGNGNFGLDPLFADEAGRDLSPAAGSPCIDAGDNAALPANTPGDLARKPRRVDDPATTDTGQGTAPLVDRGCYEFQPPAGGLRGDANCDGGVDFDDIDCFVSALIGHSAWDACGHGSDCSYMAVNDINEDGSVDFDDIDPFVECVINSGCP